MPGKLETIGSPICPAKSLPACLLPGRGSPKCPPDTVLPLFGCGCTKPLTLDGGLPEVLLGGGVVLFDGAGGKGTPKSRVKGFGLDGLGTTD